MGRGAVLEGGGGGGGRRGGRGGSVGSGGPGLGRNPSKGENFRGLQGKPRQHILVPRHEGWPLCVLGAWAGRPSGPPSSPRGRWGNRGQHWLRDLDKVAPGQVVSQSRNWPPTAGAPSARQYLMGVRGLLLRRLGERSLGWKEKPSLMLSRTEGATYVKPWGKEAGQLTLRVRHSLATTPACVPMPLRSPGPHQEGLVGALTEGRVVWTVHWCLPREVCVKLAHVLL